MDNFHPYTGSAWYGVAFMHDWLLSHCPASVFLVTYIYVDNSPLSVKVPKGRLEKVSSTGELIFQVLKLLTGNLKKLFSIVYLYWDGIGSWNPSTWKTWAHASYSKYNNFATNSLATQGAMASAATILPRSQNQNGQTEGGKPQRKSKIAHNW